MPRCPLAAPPLAALALALLFAGPAEARIKLITLPVRERVAVQLEHARATLIEEERIVPLVEGTNQVDFSWANTRIDPKTILFRVVEAPEKPIDVQVLSVSYPPGENALLFEVDASAAGSARVRISYLLGGLDKNFAYRAVAGADETTLTLNQSVRIRNLANERFETAHLNLGPDRRFDRPVGLDQTMELLAERFREVPIRRAYTVNPQTHGYLDRAQNKLNVPLHYVLENEGQGPLGRRALEAGKVRVFQESGGGSRAFLGEDWAAYTPRGESMRLYLGLAQDVVVTRTLERNEREQVTGNLFHQHVVVKYEIENFKEEAVTLDIVEPIEPLRRQTVGHTGRPAEWEIGEATTFEQDPDPERTDAGRLTHAVRLPAAPAGGAEQAPVVHKLHLIFRNEW